MAKEFKIILTGLMALFFFGFANAMPDTTMIPVYRQYFHDKINNEQKLCDRADGKLDNMMRVCNNVDINLRVTDILFRKIDELQDWVESNKNIEKNNCKNDVKAKIQAEAKEPHDTVEETALMLWVR